MPIAAPPEGPSPVICAPVATSTGVHGGSVGSAPPGAHADRARIRARDREEQSMGRIVFAGGRVFEGTGAPLAEADVVIEDGRIVEVAPGLDGDEAVDCSGKALLPGLFDCHVHLASRHEDLDELRVMYEPFSMPFFRMAENLRITLALGITTVRDAAGADAGLKRAVEECVLPGPRMQISVNMLSMTGGHSDAWLPSGGMLTWGIAYPGMPSGLCDGADGVSAKVREMIRAGADVIKIASSGGFISPSDDPNQPNFTQAEVDAIVQTAADLGRPVMSHAHGAEGIKRAVRAGVRSIEHGTFLDEEAAAMMVERGTWLVPTLTAGDTTQEMADDPRIAEPVRAKLRELGRPELDAFRLAAEAGVKVAMGTDCPVAPHGTNLHELELMAEHGFTPTQALVAATSSAADLMGLERELGTLEPDKRADVVVVQGDPFEVATLQGRIEQVWKDGVRVV
jgi:imidazolonepropionase-like amidohydrolase